MSRKARVFLAFILAVALATVLGTVFQTQFNLAALTELGVSVPLEVRLRTTGQDLLGFSPTLGALVAASFVLALPAAAYVERLWPRGRWLVFLLAGGLSVLGALMVANALAPMPTLISANRTFGGTLGLMASGALGAWLFTWFHARAAVR
ncbi:hypothetical protein [Pseudomonas sp. Marseille-QA0892]